MEKSKLDQLLGAGPALVDPGRQSVTLTLLVVDVAGTSEYFERHGAQDSGLLEQYERMGTRAVDGYGGRVVRALGDVMLAEFSEPALAVQAAIHMQRRLAQLRQTLDEDSQIQLRMGVASGPCLRAGDDLSGQGVEHTVLICKRAGPAQILISQETREAVATNTEIQCNWVGAFPLMAREENLFEVVWAEQQHYSEIRHHTTTALRRGDLLVPGLQITELAQPEVQHTSVMGLPPPERVIGQRTGEFVPMAPASLNRRYEIRGELGHGGMGVVYKAWDRETDELVALKVLRGEIAADEQALIRFRNEVRTARRVTHRNVCRIHDFNRTEDAAYISMEYIEGRSLRQIIAETAGLALDKGMAIAQQMCAGLAEAHAQGIVHRDMKPENVMVDREGTVRLLDFGIARSAMGAGVTQTGAVMGTPAYMAPEQAEGIHIDHRVDIYALGLILYEMFTGSPTFRAPTPIAVVMKHIQEQPTPPRNFKPTIPAHVEQTILRCLAKKPEHRFQSVKEVLDALEGRIEAYPAGASRPQSMADGAPTAIIEPKSPPAPAASDKPYPTVPMRTVLPDESAASSASSVPAAAAPAAQPAAAPGAGKAGMVVAIVAVVLVLFVAVAGGALLYFKPWAKQSPDAQIGTGADQTAQTQPTASPDPGGTPPQSQSIAPAGETSPPEAAGKKESAPPSGESSGPAKSPSSTPPPAKAEPAAPPPISLTVAFASAFSQRGAVNHIALTSNGQVVATAGQDNTVGVWDANAGKQIHKMRGHTASVLSVALSRDGSRLASTSSDRTTRLWSPRGGTEEKVLPRETAPVLRAAFSPDGQLLATSLGDGRIKLWDSDGSSVLQNLVGHNGPVFSIAFSADGRTLVSGGQDGTVRVWNVASGTERTAMRGHSSAVAAVAISMDGRLAASAGNDGTVRIWEISSGREVVTLNGHSGSVDAVAFGPDGRWVVSGGADKKLRVWEIPSGREIDALERHLAGITDVVVGANGRWIASSDSGGTVALWRWR